MSHPRSVRPRLLALGVTAIAPILLHEPLAAQDVVLESPEVVFPESYSFIQRVREMPDGRLLWADPLGQVLVLGDLDAATADTVGRVGEGPREYRQPDAVWALPGDSTLLVDLGNGRLTVLDPELTFGETSPIGVGQPGAGMILALPEAVDRAGNVYIAGRVGGGPRAEPPDSAPVMRYSRATGTADTMAMVKLEGRTIKRSGGAGNQQVSMRPIPLSGSDGWTVDADGRVGIARLVDYHFEWIAPDGTVTAGAPVPVDRVRIRQAEKDEWDRDRERSGGGLGVSVSMSNGVAQMSFARGGRMTMAGADSDEYEWPEAKPPFYGSGLRVDPSGRAWVRRHLEAGEPPLYDVFGPDAEHRGTVRLPVDRRLVGFGDGALYAVYMDEFDLNHLERYALPAL